MEKAAAGSIKSLDEVAEDLEYLLTHHLTTFRDQGREEQMSAFINEMMQTKDSRPEQPPWRLFDIQRSISPLSSLFDLCVTMLRLATGKSTICSVLFFISAPITPNVGWTRKNSPFSRARVYARVRRFSIFSFTASPFAPNLLRDRMMRVKASPFYIHPRWRQKCAFCSPVLAWISD